jgi:hypothetical protein
MSVTYLEELVQLQLITEFLHLLQGTVAVAVAPITNVFSLMLNFASWFKNIHIFE